MDNRYLDHYLNWQNASLFFIVSMAGLVVILLFLFAYARAREKKMRPNTVSPKERSAAIHAAS